MDKNNSKIMIHNENPAGKSNGTIEEQIAFYESHLSHLNKNAYSLNHQFVSEERDAINNKLNELKSRPTSSKIK
jgi:hypothetical protein